MLSRAFKDLINNTGLRYHIPISLYTDFGQLPPLVQMGRLVALADWPIFLCISLAEVSTQGVEVSLHDVPWKRLQTSRFSSPGYQSSVRRLCRFLVCRYYSIFEIYSSFFRDGISILTFHPGDLVHLFGVNLLVPAPDIVRAASKGTRYHAIDDAFLSSLLRNAQL